MLSLHVIEGTTKGGCILIKNNGKYIYISKPLNEETLQEFKNNINKFLNSNLEDYNIKHI